MDKESVERLRFDSRLQRRPDWIEKADQETYLSALPDVSEKMTTCAEAEDAEEAEAKEVAKAAAAKEVVATPPTATPPAAPVAGDFSASRPFGDLGGDASGN